jgi:hypothetical protein
MPQPDIIVMIMALTDWREELHERMDQLDPETDEEEMEKLDAKIDHIDDALSALENL